MKEINFPLLTKNDIEVRVGNVKQGSGFSLLLYKTARVDANILDNAVGQFNWQKKYYSLKDNIYCSVGIFNETTNEWVWKDDCGKESQTESEKGEASDSFKRACFMWGLGRELYTAPFIWVKEEKGNDKFGKYDVSEISYDENKNIKTLAIVNKNGEVVYSYGLGKKVAQTSQKAPNQPMPTTSGKSWKEKLSEHLEKLDENTKVSYRNWLAKKYNANSVNELSDEQAQEVCFLIHIK